MLDATTSDYLLIAIAYLLGSIPFGVIVARVSGLGNIQKQGSGNIGATNVARLGNKKLGALTLILDAAKGVLAVMLVSPMAPEHTKFLVAAAVVLGHIFPIWLRFKGGKGVATALAVLTTLHLPLGIGAIVLWASIFLMLKISSLASLLTMIAVPSLALLFAETTGYGMVYLSLFLCILVAIRHHGNIRRLIAGTEGKLQLDDDDD